MASSSPTSTTHSHSYFTKTITLLDWWLTKTETDVEGNNRKSLGVSGTTSTQKQAVRIFSSAPIARRYDVFTVETADQMCVVLKGFINNQRTLQNGFPSQVVKNFALGFPDDWDRYAQKCCGEDPTTAGLENLEGDQNNPASSSLRNIKSASPSVRLVTGTTDDKVTDSPSRVTIQHMNKWDMSGKCPIHSGDRVPGNFSAKTKGKMKEKRMKVCLSKTDNKKLTIVPLVSNPVSNDVQNDCCKLECGSVPFQSGKELKQPVVAKVIGKLGDGHTSNSKRGHNSRNQPKADAKEERTTGRKAKSKTTAPVHENDAKERSTTRNKVKRKVVFEEQQDNAGQCILSPECLSVGRSRSGRILLPVLEFWRNQIPVYDQDRNVTGIQEDRSVPAPERGSRSEPQKKRKQ